MNYCETNASSGTPRRGTGEGDRRSRISGVPIVRYRTKDTGAPPGCAIIRQLQQIDVRVILHVIHIIFVHIEDLTQLLLLRRPHFRMSPATNQLI